MTPLRTSVRTFNRNAAVCCGPTLAWSTGSEFRKSLGDLLLPDAPEGGDGL